MEKKMLVEGMMCAHCKAAVEKALAAVPGVNACTVDLAAKTAHISADENVSDETLMAAVKAIDFQPVKML